MNNKIKVIIIAIEIVLIYTIGVFTGYKWAEKEAMTYMGTVIEKNYQPREARVEKQKEWVDGEFKEVEKPVVIEEEYTFKVRNLFGEKYTVFVTKEEFKQLNVGEKYKR